MLRGLKITFLIHAIVALIFGIVMYLIPAMWATWVTWTPFDPAMTRIFGVALLALAVSSWFGYRAERWEEVRIVTQMEIIFTVLGLLGGLYEVLFATAPAFIWVPIIFFVVFAVAFIYFYRLETQEAHRLAAA